MEFTRSRPLATWLATLSASFAGSLVANPLLGKPVWPAIMMRMRMRVVMKTISMIRTVWISQDISSEYKDGFRNFVKKNVFNALLAGPWCPELREELADGHLDVVGRVLLTR